MRGRRLPGRRERAEARELIEAEPPMAGQDLAAVVTPPARSATTASGDGPRIAVIDTGIKGSIVRNLVARGARVALHPCTTTAEELLATTPTRSSSPTAPATRPRSTTSCRRCASSSA